MRMFPPLLFFAFFIKTCDMALECKTTESVHGRYLRRHVTSTSQAAEPMDCMAICGKHNKCKSWNFWLDDKRCELNDADRYSHAQDYQKGIGVIYSGAVDSPPNVKSCDEVKQDNSGAQSGYYWINLGGKAVQVFCDFDKPECTESAKTVVRGVCCVFPFIYRGISYDNCTDVNYDQGLWCATVPNYDVNNKWEKCA